MMGLLQLYRLTTVAVAGHNTTTIIRKRRNQGEDFTRLLPNKSICPTWACRSDNPSAQSDCALPIIGGTFLGLGVSAFKYPNNSTSTLTPTTTTVWSCPIELMRKTPTKMNREMIPTPERFYWSITAIWLTMAFEPISM